MVTKKVTWQNDHMGKRKENMLTKLGQTLDLKEW